MTRIGFILFAGLLLVASGCANQDPKRTIYNAMHDRQCIKDTGNPNCDPDHMTYDEYKAQREKLNKENNE